jgi:chemotaxis protein histidine kinase CheA
VPNRSIPTYPVPTGGPADPVLADLMPEFITLWTKDLTVTWPEIRERGDIEEFRRFGHTIKGSFLQFGFRDLSPIGRDVMSDAEIGDWEGADARIQGLLNVLNAMKEQLPGGNS